MASFGAAELLLHLRCAKKRIVVEPAERVGVHVRDVGTLSNGFSRK